MNSSQDLTELTQLQQQVAELEAKLSRSQEQRQRLLDALNEGFLLVEDEETIRFANGQARILLGGRELVDRSIHEAILDGKLLDLVRDALAFNEKVTRKVLLRVPENHPARDESLQGELALEVDVAPFSRTLHLKRITLRNVTQAHITEQVRKDFVANASHELRTPLAIVNGYLENLLDDDLVEEPKVARRFLSTMRKHSSRIARIIEDMLVISKLESGEASTLKIKPFKIIKCIDDVVERLSQMIEDSGTEVKIELADKKLKMDGDRFYWTQILFNLVENAIKQNPDNELKVVIGAKQVGDKVHLWVSDNGIGIPAAHLPFVFKRFYRVETHHSNQIRGTGLGLSIVKRGVEAHEGSIAVSSTPGKETRFEMVVPIEPPYREPEE